MRPTTAKLLTTPTGRVCPSRHYTACTRCRLLCFTDIRTVWDVAGVSGGGRSARLHTLPSRLHDADVAGHRRELSAQVHRYTVAADGADLARISAVHLVPRPRSSHHSWQHEAKLYFRSTVSYIGTSSTPSSKMAALGSFEAIYLWCRRHHSLDWMLQPSGDVCGPHRLERPGLHLWR